jgi:hypothetical protein
VVPEGNSAALPELGVPPVEPPEPPDPPEDEPLEPAEAPVEGALVVAAPEAGALAAGVLAVLDDVSAFLLGELYRSEYQPPPLRMKAPPPEIWRLAVFSWHLGQVSSAFSEMRCSTSHWLAHEEQTYS